jgi:hypothetical protein
MKTYAQILAIFLLFLLIAGCGKPASVLLITGGHSYDTTEFYDLFREMEGIEFDSVLYPAARDVLASDRIDDYDVLLFYDFLARMEPKDSIIFLNLTNQGKSMLFLHHALATCQGWEGYKAMVGGRYMMPGFQWDSTLLSDFKHDIDLEIEVLDPDHPVTRGVDNFVIRDEGYSNIQVNEGIHPLLGTNHPDASPLVAWVNDCDQSTIIYIMLGHDRHAYANNSFQLLLNNSIQWLSSQ